jgi:hypothetical protein
MAISADDERRDGLDDLPAVLTNLGGILVDLFDDVDAVERECGAADGQRVRRHV